MIGSLADLVIQYSPAQHAVATFLDRFGLPSDGEALADWLYGRPFDLADAPLYGSPELVLGAAPVRPVGTDLFEIDDAGKWAVLQPVAPDGETIVDLAAWHPASPDRSRLMVGHGEALGEREIELRQDRDGPLEVFATPLSWHRAGGRGVCLLRPTWQLAQRLFVGEHELIAETAQLGNRLNGLLRFRPVPAILTREHRRAAA